MPWLALDMPCDGRPASYHGGKAFDISTQRSSLGHCKAAYPDRGVWLDCLTCKTGEHVDAHGQSYDDRYKQRATCM